MKKINVYFITVIIVCTAFILTGCAEKKCEVCEQIGKLQTELSELDAYLQSSDAVLMEGSYEVEEKNERADSIRAQLQTMMNHECKTPVVNVTDQDYDWWGVSGKYTGEWKSTYPCGNGSFSGKHDYENGSVTVDYSGEWSGGMPNGTGELTRTSSFEYTGRPTSKIYKGQFLNGYLNGIGYYSEDFTTTTFVIPSGNFRNNHLDGEAEYIQYNIDGSLYDRGTVVGTLKNTNNGIDYHMEITYSERTELEKKRAEEEARQAEQDAADFIVDSIGDMFFGW